MFEMIATFHSIKVLIFQGQNTYLDFFFQLQETNFLWKGELILLRALLMRNFKGFCLEHTLSLSYYIVPNVTTYLILLQIVILKYSNGIYIYSIEYLSKYLKCSFIYSYFEIFSFQEKTQNEVSYYSLRNAKQKQSTHFIVKMWPKSTQSSFKVLYTITMVIFSRYGLYLCRYSLK